MDNEEVCKIFASNLKRYMREAGMTQLDLSKAVGLSTASVSAWVHGRNIPRTNVLGTLTKLFDCELADLVLVKENDLAENSEAAKAKEFILRSVRDMTDAEIIALRKIVEQVLSLRG